MNRMVNPAGHADIVMYSPLISHAVARAGRCTTSFFCLDLRFLKEQCNHLVPFHLAKSTHTWQNPFTLGKSASVAALVYPQNMLYVYISLHKPMTLAFIDLPVTGDHRSSPWSRRTRRELRDQAHLVLYDKLARPAKSASHGAESGDLGRSDAALVAHQVVRDGGASGTCSPPTGDVVLTVSPKQHAAIMCENRYRHMEKQQEMPETVDSAYR
jgi:hypothetical protein